MLDALRKLFGRKTPAPESAPQPAEEPTFSRPDPWPREMLLREEGRGGKADYPGYSCGTTRIRWVSRETDEAGQPVAVRTPRPRTLILPKALFTAAGRTYSSLHALEKERFTEDGADWCRDCFGRRVLCLRERFPCFDSGDFLYEKRYYRWFFLYEDGKLTRVQYTDERPTVTVTEDVRDVETSWLLTLENLDCFK